jgi:hypothetical protein
MLIGITAQGMLPGRESVDPARQERKSTEEGLGEVFWRRVTGRDAELVGGCKQSCGSSRKEPRVQLQGLEGDSEE